MIPSPKLSTHRTSLLLASLLGLLILASPSPLLAGAKSCERSDTNCKEANENPQDGDPCSYTDSNGTTVNGTVVVSAGDKKACDYAIAPARNPGFEPLGRAPSQLQHFEVEAGVLPHSPEAKEPTREELLQRIDDLEKEVKRLKRLLRQPR